MQAVRVASYSSSGGYEQCEAVAHWDGAAAPLRLILARNGDEFDFRLRDAGTIAFLFGGRAPMNADAYGPLVQVRAGRGFAGAILTSFPDLPNTDLERVYAFCCAVRDAVAAGGDPRAAPIAQGLQRAQELQEADRPAPPVAGGPPS